MSFDRLVEERIREAMRNGQFDNLAGRGKPVDLKPYFDAPEDLRLAFSVLKSAGHVPEEVDLLKELGSLKAALADSPGGAKAALLKRAIQEATLKLNLMIERRKRRGFK